MQQAAYHHPTQYRKTSGVVSVVGQGVKIRVRRHALHVEDGFPLEGPPRSRAVHRALGRVGRVLLLAGSGFATLDALDWCAKNGAPIVAVDQSGALRWALLPGQGGEWACRLRRAQALAPFTETGLEIARWLITRKIAGQRDVLKELGRSSKVETFLAEVERAQTIPHLRYVEARAADAYWRTFVGLPIHFAPPSYKKRTPAHWTTFRGRGSPISNGARNAADPINALENYAYSLLEAEARIACHEGGLDPYLSCTGLHTDQDARRSLVYDIMEPVRPVADRLVLNLVLGHAFRPGELWSLRDGRCRLDQDLCARLWPWMPMFRKALGPVMTFLVSRLRQGVKYTERVGRTGGRRYWASETKPVPLRTAGMCRSCGVFLEGMTNRRYCDACLSERRRAVTNSNLSVANDRLRQLRKEGRDPAHGGPAARARRESLARHRREADAWDGDHATTDPRVFKREILPYLRDVTLRQMAKATNLSPGYCAMVRKGMYTPHPRHWGALNQFAQIEKKP